MGDMEDMNVLYRELTSHILVEYHKKREAAQKAYKEREAAAERLREEAHRATNAHEEALMLARAELDKELDRIEQWAAEAKVPLLSAAKAAIRQVIERQKQTDAETKGLGRPMGGLFHKDAIIIVQMGNGAK